MDFVALIEKIYDGTYQINISHYTLYHYCNWHNYLKLLDKNNKEKV